MHCGEINGKSFDPPTPNQAHIKKCDLCHLLVYAVIPDKCKVTETLLHIL